MKSWLCSRLWLLLQTSAVAHSRAGRMWRAFVCLLSSKLWTHWRRDAQDLPGLLVTNEGNNRNVQFERLSKNQRDNIKDTVKKELQAGEGR